MNNKTIEDKKCSICGVVKPLTEFMRESRRKTGYGRLCRPCNAEQSRQAYARYPKTIQARTEEYRKKNWDKIKEAMYKRHDPQKQKARQAVRNAVVAGKFEKADCQHCSDIKTDFHHTEGYDKDHWFTGIWLCRKHHAQIHRELRAQERATT